MIGVRFIGIILAGTLLAGGIDGSSAVGQSQQAAPGVSALKGHDSNAPVDVTAQRLEVQDRADRAVFVGTVHATQGNLSLDTQRLTVAYQNSANGAQTGNVHINRLDAAGGVVVHSPTESAKGNFGIYDLDRKLITLIGNVQLNQGQNQLNGQRLVINLDSGRAVVDGGPPGVNSSGGRVTGHFLVPQHQQPPQHPQTPQQQK